MIGQKQVRLRHDHIIGSLSTSSGGSIGLSGPGLHCTMAKTELLYPKNWGA
jgi:hypothetical protein